MEEDICPDCGNEIYKPYSYCNACGWEKGEEEEEEKKGKKGEKEKKAKGKKDAKGKKEPKKEKKKETKPMKLKCKCGATIKVKSSKRPIKVECPECGRTGTIKEPVKAEKEKISKPEKEKPKKPKGKEEKRKGKKPHEKPAMKTKDQPKVGKKRKKGKVPVPAGPKTKEKMKPKVEDTDEDYCPECGTRLAVTGVCPNCGYRAGPGRAYKARDDEKRKKGKKHKPPKGARSVKPKKGICSKCNSKKLRFYDDGSGRCSDCGREFRWDGGASRVQEDEYECPKCGELLEWIEDYKRWYCYKCEEYQ